MSTPCKDMNSILQSAMEQLTPDMVHVCLLPSATFVKVTRIVNVVQSQTLVRDDERTRCPPGSKDLHPDGGEPRAAPDQAHRRRGPRKPASPRRRPKK